MERVKILGLTCAHCVRAVARALEQVSGLREVKVNLEKGEATFENDGGASAEEIRRAVEEAGYEVAG